jgi:hypothetical protein
MVRAKIKIKIKTKIKAILYRLKDFIEVRIGKIIKRHYRHLSNSNLNLPITLFLTRKSYTGPDITRNAAI